MRIRICERKFPDSGHKPEGKEVFIRRIQKRAQALKFTAELSERMRVFCCKFCS